MQQCTRVCSFVSSFLWQKDTFILLNDLRVDELCDTGLSAKIRPHLIERATWRVSSQRKDFEGYCAIFQCVDETIQANLDARSVIEIVGKPLLIPQPCGAFRFFACKRQASV
jgi:hypothetical protein